MPCERAGEVIEAVGDSGGELTTSMLSGRQSLHFGASWCHEGCKQDDTAKRQSPGKRSGAGSELGEEPAAEREPDAGGAHRERNRGGEAEAAGVLRTCRAVPQHG